MVIGIDVSAANKENRTGVEWYVFHLIHELKGIDTTPHRVVLYSPSPLGNDLKDLPANWESQVLKWPGKGWNTFRLSWEMLRRKPDVLFIPANKIPFFHPKNTVVTVHDIAPERVPEVYEPRVRARIKLSTRSFVKKAAGSARILTVSEFTKKELMDVFKVAEDKMIVTPLATEPDRYKQLPADEVNSVLAKYRLGHSYFFHVGRLETKKNINTLLRAFEMFKERRGLGDPVQLVLAGTPGYEYQTKIKPFLENPTIKDSVRELGFVSEEDLPALINGATAYTFPSWYEGFGIPALEAMACGTVLIASDIGALREVAGDAAVFTSPKEPEAWAKAMERIMVDSTLREELIAQGLVRSQEFSWAHTAQKTWEVLAS